MQKRKDSKGRVLKDGETQRKDGIYMFRYTGEDKKRHYLYSKDLNDLREKEEKLNQDKCLGIRVEEKNTTLNNIYYLWKTNKKGLKSSTAGNYYYMYEHYVKDDLGIMKIQQMKRSDIMRFYNNLIDSKGLSMNTLETIQNVLYQIFQVAVHDDYIRKNITEDVLGECKKARNYEAPKRHALTIPEQKAFINYIKETPKFKHWLPIFTFFLGTGCRIAEVCGLTWNDVDFENNCISINHSLVYYDREQKKTYHYISTPKTSAGIRIIPLLPEVKKALLDEKKYQEEAGIKCIASYSGYTDFVFLNRFGDVHNPQTVNRTIKRIVLAYNEEEACKAVTEDRDGVYLPDFSCHNLRHTFCTRLCENESNLKVIQTVMGHKDIATTMEVYAEATQEKLVETFANLEGKITIA